MDSLAGGFFWLGLTWQRLGGLEWPHSHIQWLAQSQLGRWGWLDYPSLLTQQAHLGDHKDLKYGLRCFQLSKHHFGSN